MTNVDPEVLVKIAEQCLTKPSDFGWWGRDEMFESWGMTWSVHRDSDLLERCNWTSVINMLQNNDGVVGGAYYTFDSKDWEINSCSHWAVGWVEYLCVRILEDEDGDICEDNLTDIFKALAELKLNLEVYPILDEELYFRMEWEEMVDAIHNYGPSMVVMDEEKASDVLGWMINEFNYIDPESIHEDYIIEAAMYLDLIDPDYEDEFAEWCEEHLDIYNEFLRKLKAWIYRDQLALF